MIAFELIHSIDCIKIRIKVGVCMKKNSKNRVLCDNIANRSLNKISEYIEANGFHHNQY